MLYQVQYRTLKGQIASLPVDAEDEQDAREKAGQAASRVISVKPDTWNRIKQRLLYPVPSLIDQALFLQNLSALLTSGEDVTRSIKRLLVGQAAFKFDAKKVAAAVTCVDYLNALQFNKSAIVLAEVGERSATLGTSLQTAAESMLEREKLLKQLGKSIWQALIYVFLGFALLFGLPLVLGGTLITIMEETGDAFVPNAWTHFILNTRHFLMHQWILVLGVIVIIIAGRKQIWEALKDKPGFSSIRDFSLLRRALSFLTAYKPLFQAGIPDPRCLAILQSQATGSEKSQYEQMHRDLRAGKDLAYTLDTPEWPVSLRFSMSNFGQLQNEKKDVLVNTLISTMRHQVEIISQKIARNVTVISWICIILGIASIALGYYMPLATMRASVT